jgi:hypothetical protein
VSDEVGGYDFFVSYTQADRAWAEWLAWDLEQTGHRVLVQAWDFVPGSNWVARMQDGVTGADRTIAVLSDAYLSSVFGAAEWQAAWAADPGGEARKLLVVRVADCERPGLLSTVVSRDLFGVGEAESRARLRRLVQEAKAGRAATPDTAPPFPPSMRAIVREPRFPTALPRVWRVPPQNPNFTGRTHELGRLETGLRSAHATPVTVHSLHGMGGVGKTQLATQYAYVHATDYDVVWWIDAEQAALIPDQFRSLGAKLGLVLPAGGDPDDVRDAVHTALRDVPGWLLVLDNAEEPSTVQPWIPSGPFPAGTAAQVLVTTRRHGYKALGQVVDLDTMTAPEAVELLTRRLPDLDADTAARISDVLGYLPLALDQAAAYLDQTGMDPTDWLRLWASRSSDLQKRGHLTFHRDTIATLWSLSLDRLRVAAPAAVQLIEVCSYLAPDPIPLDLFTRHLDVLPSPLNETATDPLAFADTLAALGDYSLIKRSPTTLQIHRLVQDVIRARTPDGRTPSALDTGQAGASDA